MANEIPLEISLGTGDAISALNNLTKSLDSLSSIAQDLNSNLSKAFSKTSSQIDSVNKGIEQSTKDFFKLNDAVTETAIGLGKTTDETDFLAASVRSINTKQVSNLGSAFDSVSDAAKSAVSQIQSGIGFVTGTVNRLGDAIFNIQNALIAAAGAIGLFKLGQFLGEAIGEANQAQVALNELNVSLRLAGTFSEESSKRFQDLAGSIQDTTKYTDEAVLSSVALAKQFNLTNDDTERLVKAATNLAAVTGVDLKTATQELALTYEGNTRALGKQVPAVKDLTKAQLEAGDAIRIVEERLKGAAAAAAGTFAGQVTQLKNKFSDFSETVGNFVIQNPAVLKALKDINSLVSTLGTTLKSNETSVDPFINSLLVVATEAIPVVIKLFDSFQVVSGTIGRFFERLVGVVFNVIGAITNLGATVDGVRLRFDLILKVPSLLKDAFIISGQAIEEILVGIVEGITRFATYVTSAFPSISEKFKGVADATTEYRQEVEKARVAQTQAFEDTLKQDYSAVWTKAGNTINKVADDQLAAQNLVSESLQGLTNNVEKYGAELINIAETEKRVRKDGSEQIENQIKAYQRLTAAEAKAVADFGKSNPLAIFFPDPNVDPLNAYLINANKKLVELEGQQIALFEQGISDTDAQFQALNKAIQETEQNIKNASAAATAGQAAGFLETLNKGAQGAADIVSGVFGKIAETIIPGIGGAVSSIVNILAKGPDEVKKFTKAFVDGLGAAIQNIILSIPALVNTLITSVVSLVINLISSLPDLITQLISGLGDLVVNLAEAIPKILEGILEGVPKIIDFLITDLPRIITSFVDKIPILIESLAAKLPILAERLATEMPKVAERLSQEAPKIALQLAVSLASQAPRIAGDMITEFVRNIPTFFVEFRDRFLKLPREFLDGLLNGLKEGVAKIFDVFKDIGGAISNAGKGIGGAVTDILGTIGIKFAQGGMVPQGFPNDTFPARLTSGEFIIDRSTTDRLNSYLDRQQSGGGGGLDTQAIISALSRSGGSNQPIQVNLVVGEKELASAMLDLNRQGFRTA